ncbi:MAG: Ig-like domain-containing protein, partial [Actinomycetes bacterium]
MKTSRRQIASVVTVCGLVAAGLFAVSAPAQAAVLGSLKIAPGSGNLQTVISVSTPGQCDQGSNIKVIISGAGVQSATENIVGNTAITSYPTNLDGGFDIEFPSTLADYGTTQSPALTSFSGRYDISVICKNSFGATTYGTFTGSLYFSSGTAWTSTKPATTTTLTATPANSSYQGENVHLEAAVTPLGVAGTVQFKDGAVDLGSVSPAPTGVASLDTTALTVGSHTLTAVFTPADALSFGESTSNSVSYEILTPAAPSVITGASATGTYKVGYTLACGATFQGASSTAYAWLNNGVAISGQTASTFYLSGSYYNRTISCRATGHNTYGDTPSTSAGHLIALGSKPTLRKAPVISGTVKVGKTILTSKGTWSLSGLTYSYQWKRNGKSIAGSGARKISYKVVAADKGKYLTCTVTVRKTGYASNSATTGRKKAA